MPSDQGSQGIQSIFSQNLDRAVFAAYLLGAVVPLLGLSYVAQRYALPSIESESRLAVGMIVAIAATAVLSLGAFLMLRRVTLMAVARMNADNRRLQQLLEIARSLPAIEHSSDVAQLAAESACALTEGEACFVVMGSGADKPLAINGAAGDEAAAIETAHADEIYDLAAECFADGLQQATLGADAVAVALPLGCSSVLGGALIVVRSDSDFTPKAIDAGLTLAALTSVSIDNSDLREAQRNFFAHVTDLLVTALDSHVDRRDRHATRVARLSNRIGRALGLSDERLQRLHFASLLHDLGMLKIPHDQQRNPAQFRRHTQIGHKLLARIRLWQEIAPIVLYHHERWDGQGYPEGLAGDAIPLESRIIHAADAFDAMTRDDTHRHAMTLEDAREELRSCAGSQFDPDVIGSLEQLIGSGDLDDELASLG